MRCSHPLARPARACRRLLRHRFGAVPAPVLPRGVAHAEGAGDGAQVQGERAKKRQHQGSQTGERERQRQAGDGAPVKRGAVKTGITGSKETLALASPCVADINKIATASVMGTELVKPTSSATKPAANAQGLRSLKQLRNVGDRACSLRVTAVCPTRSQISIFEPNSTTELLGSFRKSAAPLALWCICANSFSRHCAMPLPMVGMTVSRDRK